MCLHVVYVSGHVHTYTHTSAHSYACGMWSSEVNTGELLPVILHLVV